MSAQRSGSRNRVARSVAHGGRLKRMRKVKPTRGTAIFALFRGPSLLPPGMRISMYRIDFWRFQQQRFFLSKIKDDPGHGGICCSRRRVKMASRKRQPRDGANFGPLHFLSKKRKIDGLPSLILSKKCEKRECRRAKMASRM